MDKYTPISSSTGSEAKLEPPKISIISDNGEDVLKSAKTVEEEGSDDSDDDVSSKAKADRKERMKYEYALLKYIRELFAIQERLYAVRYEKQRPAADVQRDVTNLIREHVRIQAVIELLQMKSEASFENSINLQALGVPSSFQDEEYRPLADNVALGASISNLNMEDDLFVLGDLDSLKFMRTRSTNTLKDQAPAQRWNSMFKMFREWKVQKNTAQAQKYVASAEERRTPARAHSNLDEIASLRTAIRNLRLKKELPKSDHLLLKKMTARLKELTNS